MFFVACHVNSKLQNFAAVRTICCTGNTHALASFRHPSVTRLRASRGKPGTSVSAPCSCPPPDAGKRASVLLPDAGKIQLAIVPQAVPGLTRPSIFTPDHACPAPVPPGMTCPGPDTGQRHIIRRAGQTMPRD